MTEEGYFAKIDREAEPLRKEVEPFTDAVKGKMKLLDLSEHGQTDCQEMGGCPELVICLLASNVIKQIQYFR